MGMWESDLLETQLHQSAVGSWRMSLAPLSLSFFVRGDNGALLQVTVRMKWCM